MAASDDTVSDVLPKRVGLNLVYLVPGETGGMEVVARELIPALREARPELDLVAFINREAAEAADGPWGDLVPAVTVPVNARNRVEWVRGEQQYVPRLAAREGVDLVHSLASTAPAWGRFRRVVTIHDLIYRHYPDAHAGVLTYGMRVLVRTAAMRSHRVMADSASTRDDLVKLLKVKPEKVDVVPLGVGQTAHGPAVPEADLRARFDLGDKPVVLNVSAKRPHKNQVALVEALALIEPEERPMLVITGPAGMVEDELDERVARHGLKDSVRVLGFVERDELEGLYALAACFAFPSLYEGFGLPVLEAMQRGVPVATSRASSLPEVAGDAALTFDPHSPVQIADAVGRILRDPQLAAKLRDDGRAQAARFTWRRTAEDVLRSYERAMP